MKKLLAIFALSGAVFSATSQINRDVEVTRNYDPAVMDAQKIWYEPASIADSTNVRDGFSYSIFPKSSPGNFGLSPISSAKIIDSDNAPSGIGYLRAGIGYQISPLLDFYISNKNTESILVGFYANHRSFFGKTKLEGKTHSEKMKSNFMNNDLGIFSQFFLDASTITVNVDYSRRDLYLYGFDPDFLIADFYGRDLLFADYKRAMNLFNGNVLWKSDKDAGEVFYSLGASYQFFNLRDKFIVKDETRKENAFAVSGLFGADLDDDVQSVSIAARAALYSRNDILDGAGNNILLSALPSWTYNDDYLSIRLGAQYLLDSYNSKTKHRIYPAVSASYKIHDYFTPMLEVKGETEVNNFRKLALENNYISPHLSFRNTNHKLIGTFSIKGDVESFSYSVFASYSKLEYLPLFYNTAVGDVTWWEMYDGKLFYTDYFEGNKTGIGAELSYSDDVFSLYAKAVYNKYNLKIEGFLIEQEHAWHKPAFESNLNMRYKLSDDVILTADFRGLFQRYALDIHAGQDRKLKNVLDLGLGAELLVNTQFSLFFNLSNVLNQKYDIYSRYQVPGFIASAGLTYRF